MALFTGNTVFRYESLPSTNVRAWELLADNPPEGTVILTREQTAGRGQKGNTWQAVPGINLTFSVIYRPGFLDPRDLFALSKCACLAVRDVVATSVPGAEVLVKWPNDILVNRRKVAGILIENQLAGARVQAAVIGIGLNVNQTQFPPEIADRATSLSLEAGRLMSLEAVLSQVLDRLEGYYIQLRQGQTAALDQTYLAHLYGYQEEVSMTFGGARQHLRILGTDRSGKLAATDGRIVHYFDIKEVSLQVEPLE
ncbi:MAG: biotin--[acetyl-CoA-carboxylase] ligase [Bacteroidia bacterium]|nr:biotin--[acetyl-CoA-carboxylase] ligase [Bacteroidia bacterium]